MRKEHLKELFDSIITKDAIAGYGIRKNLELKTILLSQKMKALQMELTKTVRKK